MQAKKKVLIVGAGPAGLAAAYEFIKQRKQNEYQIEIAEIDNQVGGISKTLEYQGYRFDLGGHRFYTKFPEIQTFYREFLDRDMLERSRLSRIFYGGKFYDYPLTAVNALTNLGLSKAIKIVASWTWRQLHRYPQEKTFDQWVINRFGDELFKTFFKSYTEKLWGIPTSQLSADWAQQRIQNFNLWRAILDAFFKINLNSKTIIKKFYYPKYGPGMLYQQMQRVLENNGVKIRFQTEVTGFERQGNLIDKVITYDYHEGKKKLLEPDFIISTMPFNKLILALKPEIEITEEMRLLSFRSFITVNLIIRSNPFPDQWIYIHEPTVRVGRIQNFRNWSPYMVKKKENNTPIGMEYFASENDEFWNKPDQEIIQLAKKEITKIGLVKPDDILDGFVYRVRNAYPRYDYDYLTYLQKAKSFINEITNLQVCGRGGLFRYNNQDHSILTGFYAARNIISGRNQFDVWSVNEEKKYIEEQENN